MIEGIFNTPTALFDLYHLLVEIVFGSVLLSIFGVAFALMFILLICRSSMIFFVLWMAFYFAVMGTLYIGGLAMIFVFLIGFIYFSVSLLRMLGRTD